MSDRKCPYCGEKVPSFSLNCPKCYRSIPREEETEQMKDSDYRIPDDRAPSVKVYDRRIIFLLALIPAAFGLTGMAQLYMGNKRKALDFFLMGFPIYVLLIVLIAAFGAFSGGNALATVLAVACIILFLVTYVIQAIDALVRSLFVFSK